MIAGIFHEGSGLGNQLHRYVGTRVIAIDYGEKHAMVAPELFKGHSFMKLNMGIPINAPYTIEYPAGKVITDVKTVDGEFQDSHYFEHRLDEIRGWLKVDPIDLPDDVCVINFRGGEYVGVKDLFLPQEYWNKAIALMKEKYPDIRFVVHTDDPVTAHRFFPNYEVIQDMGFNWRAIRYAKHLIISNSSFAILPALLNEDVKEIIAPKYWAGYNKGYWQLPQNHYQKFNYIHHEDK